MKRVMVALMVLLLAGVIVSSGAFSSPSSLSGLGFPSFGSSSFGSSLPSGTASSGMPSSYGSSVPSSLGGIDRLSSYGSSVPSSDMQVTTPAQTGFSNWNLNDMQFFSPSNRASTGSLSMIPQSDYSDIAQLLSQLPTSDQMSQYSGAESGAATATATPVPVDSFTDISSTVPADQVIFIEITKNTMLVDPTGQGIIVPNVTMNYQFSDSKKQLLLKTKPGVDINNSQIIFGFSDSDDVNNRYTFDYSVGSSTGVSVIVLFQGADGRVRISVNGVQKDLKPGEKYEAITTEGGTRTVLDVTNWGLVPKANIQVKDTL